MNNILTIAVSTVSDNFDDLMSYIIDVQNRLPEGVIFLVVSQLENSDSYECIDGIDVFKTSDKGLSKSRNLAVRKCNSEWLWFQDDDISIVTDKMESFVEFLRGYGGDVSLVKVASLEEPSQDFKDYKRYRVNKYFLPFRVSSIEIVVRLAFIKKANVWFDENLGLGTDLPSCEENLFFYDLVVRNKSRHIFYDKAICLHTKEHIIRNIDYGGRYRARGYLLGNIGYINALFLMTWWAFRKTTDGVPIRRRLSLMLGEFFKVIGREYSKRDREAV